MTIGCKRSAQEHFTAAAPSSPGWQALQEQTHDITPDVEKFMCTLVHNTKELPKEDFKREVERYLTGKETEP